MKQYKVVGPCEVAGVVPGGTVSQQQLDEARALVEPLLGVHLQEIPEAPAAKADK